MEIEFFGVSGTSIEDTSFQGINESENVCSLINNLLSNYDIGVNIINSDISIKTLKNIEI